MNSLRQDSYNRSLKLFNIQKSDIKTYRDFSFLAYLVRNELDRKGTRERKITEQFFELANFIFSNYSISKKHYKYISEKSGVNLNSEFKTQIEKKRTDLYNAFEEYSYSKFNFEYELRIVETIFGSSENLNFPKETILNLSTKRKREEIEYQNFEKLKDLFWTFVEEAKNNQMALA